MKTRFVTIFAAHSLAAEFGRRSACFRQFSRTMKTPLLPVPRPSRSARALSVLLIASSVFVTPTLRAQTQGPIVTRIPVSQWKYLGQSAEFSVEATGTPPLSSVWLFNGKPVTGATNANLVFGSVTFADAGRYSAVVSNSAGSVTSAESRLTVLPRDSAPGSLAPSFDPTAGGRRQGPATSSGEVVALARQPDGKLVIGGQFSGCQESLRRHIARVHSTGELDKDFDPGLGFDGHVYAVALQTDGRILAGGAFSVVDAQR